MTPLSAAAARRRLLLLTTTRWFPVGLVIGLTTLLPLERGLSLSEIAVVLAVQGFVVLGLVLPTGGLADAVGRRPLLVVAALVAVLSGTLFMLVDVLGELLPHGADHLTDSDRQDRGGDH